MKSSCWHQVLSFTLKATISNYVEALYYYAAPHALCQIESVLFVPIEVVTAASWTFRMCFCK